MFFRAKFGAILAKIDIFWSSLVKNFKSLWKTITQGFKTCGKEASFAILGEQKWFLSFRSKFGPIWSKSDLFGPSTVSISNFYRKFFYRASNHEEKWPCLTVEVNWSSRSKLGPIITKIDLFWPSEIKISKFYEKFLFRVSSGAEKWSRLAL